MKTATVNKMRETAWPLAMKVAACAMALVLAAGMAPAPAAAETFTIMTGTANEAVQESSLASDPDGEYLWTWPAGSTKWTVGQGETSVRCRVNFVDNSSFRLVNGPKVNGKNFEMRLQVRLHGKDGCRDVDFVRSQSRNRGRERHRHVPRQGQVRQRHMQDDH